MIALSEALGPDWPVEVRSRLTMRYAAVTKNSTVMNEPATKAAEFFLHFSLMARNTAVMIWGPAIITKVSGRTFRMLCTS